MPGLGQPENLETVIGAAWVSTAFVRSQGSPPQEGSAPKPQNQGKLSMRSPRLGRRRHRPYTRRHLVMALTLLVLGLQAWLSLGLPEGLPLSWEGVTSLPALLSQGQQASAPEAPQGQPSSSAGSTPGPRPASPGEPQGGQAPTGGSSPGSAQPTGRPDSGQVNPHPTLTVPPPPGVAIPAGAVLLFKPSQAAPAPPVAAPSPSRDQTRLRRALMPRECLLGILRLQEQGQLKLTPAQARALAVEVRKLNGAFRDLNRSRDQILQILTLEQRLALQKNSASPGSTRKGLEENPLLPAQRALQSLGE